MLAEGGPAADPALVLDAAVGAGDQPPAAVFASRLDPAVGADGRLSAVPACVLEPAVGAEIRPAALLAFTLGSAMKAVVQATSHCCRRYQGR